MTVTSHLLRSKDEEAEQGLKGEDVWEEVNNELVVVVVVVIIITIIIIIIIWLWGHTQWYSRITSVFALRNHS